MSHLKLHVSLDTPAFDASVAFYRAFLGVDPVKHKPGYAKFDVDAPSLNLTLNETTAAVASGALNHLGIQVDSTAAVDAAKDRLEGSGLATLGERDTDCCYALQDKIWVSDPSGNRWEIFVVKQADTRPDLEVPVGQSPNAPDATACCEPGCCSP